MKVLSLLISGILTAGICLAASTNNKKPVSMPVSNDEQVIITLSSHDINRLVVLDDKIVSINAPHNRLVAHNDASGAIFMSINGATSFTAFITTERGRHFSVLITPKRQPGVTIQFIPKTPAAVHYENHSSEAKQFEKSTPYEKTLVHLLKMTMLGKRPPGYSAVPLSSLKKMPAFHVNSHLLGNRYASQVLSAGFLGGELAVRIITVRNSSTKKITLHATDFYTPGVRAVAVEKETLGLYESGDVYEVISND